LIGANENRHIQPQKTLAQIQPGEAQQFGGTPQADPLLQVIGDWSYPGNDVVAEIGSCRCQRRSLGKFLLATNKLKVQRLPAAEMLANYTA
jgi:hypothetical protein